MANLRQLLTGSAMALGLSGLVAATDVQAEDTGLCTGDSRPTAMVTDRTYERDVLNYNGAVIVLHYGTQASRSDLQNASNNAKSIIDKLALKYCGVEADGQPLRFAVLDAQHRAYARMATGNLTGEQWGVTEYPTTIMYLDGEEIDRRRSAPKDSDKIDNNVNGMSAWIDSNLLGKPFIYKGEETRIFFDGKFLASFPPYSTAPIQP